jgi:two-component system, LytTR family, response regulator
MKAILVDDEEKSRRVLRNLLEKFCTDVKVVAEADGIEKAAQLIKELKPELVFLDIQMPTGNGFDLLKKYDDLPFEVIFVTSYDEYAINAIKFSALDYLMKPVVVEDLVNAVSKAAKKIGTGTTGLQVINLLNNTAEDHIEKSVAVHVNEKVMFIKLSTILRIEADNRYAHLHCRDGNKYTVTKTLKEFEEFLINNRSFARINKNYMLNLNSVKNYSKGEPCIIETEDGMTFEVSRRKKQEILEVLKRFV